MTRCNYLISTTKEASRILEKECPYCMQKVIKMGRKESNHHGYTWFECKECDWKTIEKLVTNQPK